MQDAASPTPTKTRPHPYAGDYRDACDVCGHMLPRQSGGRPRQRCPGDCTAIYKALQRVETLLSKDVHADEPEGVRFTKDAAKELRRRLWFMANLTNDLKGDSLDVDVVESEAKAAARRDAGETLYSPLDMRHARNAHKRSR